MKKSIIFIFFVCCSISVRSQLLIDEKFDHMAGDSITRYGWSVHGAFGSNFLKIENGSLLFENYQNTYNGGMLHLKADGIDVNKTFVPQTNGNIYIAFLVNISALTPNKSDYFIHLGSEISEINYFARVFTSRNGNNRIAFGIQNASCGDSTHIPTFTGYNYNLNITYLVLSKFDIDAGISSILVNPVVAADEPTGWLTNN